VLFRSLHKIGLLGTRYTMEEDFYRGRLVDKHGLEVIIPPAQDRSIVHRVIYDELVLGKVLPASRLEYKRVIDALVENGAEGIILGCTEIGLLVKDTDSSVALFDTTRIHAEAAVRWAIN
jgi:aspartate racemase